MRRTLSALWVVIALASADASAEAYREIHVTYDPAAAPVSAAAFNDAFSKASNYWFGQCKVRFVVESNQPVAVRIGWGALPPNLLADTKKTTVLNIPLASKITIAPTIRPIILNRVLAHEFGHVLGLNHSDDKRSIMHPDAGGALLLPDQVKLCTALSQ